MLSGPQDWQGCVGFLVAAYFDGDPFACHVLFFGGVCDHNGFLGYACFCCCLSVHHFSCFYYLFLFCYPFLPCYPFLSCYPFLFWCACRFLLVFRLVRSPAGTGQSIYHGRDRLYGSVEWMNFHRCVLVVSRWVAHDAGPRAHAQPDS